ncbi:hypothetical protein, partial [Litorivivens sp.]|uniref:hypothetical protein n=1 Tax=Litorivivens sp. TaxID=2020868 RepID=UPI003563EC83
MVTSETVAGSIRWRWLSALAELPPNTDFAVNSLGAIAHYNTATSPFNLRNRMMSQIVETLINLGLGKPAELKRATTPFQGTVLLGSGPNPGCMNALSLFCQQHGL